MHSNSLEGHLLIAAPRMGDSVFDRSVVLMLHHDENGAMGIILNRPMSFSGNQGQFGPVQLLEALAQDSDRRVQLGGPVSGPLIVLHQASESEEGSARGGVFVIERREQLEQLVQQSDSSLSFFVGHAGWSAGQLEQEIANGAWLSTPAAPEFVFGDHEDMWTDAIRETGRTFYREVLNIHEFPADSSLN
ncbi:MAG: YqgE/AlgH family protein [Planctomycetota bacterium]